MSIEVTSRGSSLTAYVDKYRSIDFSSTFGFRVLLDYPFYQTNRGYGLREVSNGLPRLPRSRDTSPQSQPRKLAMGMDQPALAGPEF